MVMMNLIRVLTMPWVESAQLVMSHPGFDSEEVEVEVDEECWMQTTDPKRR